MKSKEQISINKMIDYIDKAIKYTHGYSYDTFYKNQVDYLK